MLSSLLGRLGLTSSSADAPPSGAALAAGAHVWCLMRRNDLLFAGDAKGRLHVWRTAEDSKTSASFLGTLEAHDGTVYALLARSDALISAGTDGICVWRDATASEQSSGMLLPVVQAARAGARTSDEPVLALADGGDGFFSGGADGRVARWALAPGADLATCEIGTFPGHNADDVLPFDGLIVDGKAPTNAELYEFIHPMNPDRMRLSL